MFRVFSYIVFVYLPNSSCSIKLLPTRSFLQSCTLYHYALVLVLVTCSLMYRVYLPVKVFYILSSYFLKFDQILLWVGIV